MIIGYQLQNFSCMCLLCVASADFFVRWRSLEAERKGREIEQFCGGLGFFVVLVFFFPFKSLMY